MTGIEMRTDAAASRCQGWLKGSMNVARPTGSVSASRLTRKDARA